MFLNFPTTIHLRKTAGPITPLRLLCEPAACWPNFLKWTTSGSPSQESVGEVTLTCIVAGVDPRFRAAVPVYGCGFLADNSCWLQQFADMTPEWKQQWIRLFDPSQYVGRATMPILFVNGTTDFAYPLDSYQKTYRLVNNRTLCVTVDMPHGHEAGWAPKEIGIFIDHILRGTPPLPQVDAQAQLDSDYQSARLKWQAAGEVTAQFHWTNDAGPWQNRKWKSKPVSVNGQLLKTNLPTERPLCGFFTVTDSRGRDGQLRAIRSCRTPETSGRLTSPGRRLEPR